MTEQRGSRPTAATGPLRVHPENGRYFGDGTGRAIYLTGLHTWANIVDIGPGDPPPPFDFGAYLDYLARFGHNFTRLWTWEPGTWDTAGNGDTLRKQAVHSATPHPWARVGPGAALDGKPKFDLDRFNPAYFDRLRCRAIAARERGIYVSVMLFEGWAMQFSAGAWEAHPFHPSNNANGIDGDTDRDGNGLDIYTLASRKVTALQEAYVRQVIDTVNDMDNVLYEISNENHGASTEWQYHLIRFIKETERQRPKQHLVGMTFQHKGGSNRALFDSPADWISPNAEGGFRDDPPAGDGSKVILTDTDHLWGVGGNPAWVWKSFLRGLHPLFMDPYDGVVLGERFDPRWDPIRRALGDTLRYARRMNLAQAAPHNDLTSTGYCLAVPGSAYLVYVPSGVSAKVDLSAAAGDLTVEWFDPSIGQAAAAPPVPGGARRDCTAPFAGDAVLFIRKREQ
jgi:Family of unknown function (DUF6298)/Putative collagen-binding domain of a collagenase